MVSGTSGAGDNPADNMSQALKFTAMDREAARAIIDWRYPPPYDMYNIITDAAEAVISAFLDPEFAYYKITGDDDELAAFCNFGLDARVPGGDYSEPALDIGMGVLPELTGKGLGSGFAQAVITFAEKKYQTQLLRVTIAAFNKRAQRVWEKSGFKQEQHFKRSLDGKEFIILVKRQHTRE